MRSQEQIEFEQEEFEVVQFQNWMEHIGAKNFSCNDPNDLYQDIIFDLETDCAEFELYMITNFRNISITSLDKLQDELMADWDQYLDQRFEART